jgi:hypothetical protein
MTVKTRIKWSKILKTIYNVKLINSRIMRWVSHVTRMEENGFRGNT